MATPNLYWPVYRNLEKEVLELAENIHFSDDQLTVYSMHIADLIVRCTIEIEALSKELYRQLGGNPFPTDKNGSTRDLYFDTDCLDLLEQKWRLSKKRITVSAINFYFSDEKNKVITPLYKANKRGSSGSKWKQAYQAVKHDRRESLKKATILNLLYAMGALFILNLYYKNETVDLGPLYLRDLHFDNCAGSELFSAFCFNATGLSLSTSMGDRSIITSDFASFDQFIFIEKYDEQSFKAIHKDYCLDKQNIEENFLSSTEIADFLNTHPESQNQNLGEICIRAGGIDLVSKIVTLPHSSQKHDTRVEVILNKHSSIYPDLFPPDRQATIP